MAEKTGGRRVRCAIYTRKSSDEGLEQEFNSLHAQREAGEAFVLSQRHEGWHVLAAHYDDGGFSGGTTKRPALQRLLSDIGDDKVDVVMVYKIDRLTRSLFDFAKIVAAFDAKSVSFVSITQQFNTTTSMGRLTLNVLLSFAQFEREVTSERIRDKIAASKQKGMWMGGTVPIGFDVVDRKLRVNAEEAKTVRLLFDLYLELGSVRELQAECQRRDLRTKLRTLHDGRQLGGKAFSRGHLYCVLSNPLLIGRIPHRRRSYDGQHEAIIDAVTWERVQAQLASNARRQKGRLNSRNPSPLAGLLFTAKGVPFTPSHAVKGDRRHRYYVERSLLSKNKNASADHQGVDALQPKGWRLPAHQVEQLVFGQLAAFLRNGKSLLDALPSKLRSPNLVSGLLAQASALADLCIKESSEEQIEIVKSLVQRITIANEQVIIEIGRAGLASKLGHETPGSCNKKDRSDIKIEVSVSFRRRGVEAKLVVAGKREANPRPDVTLIKAIRRAHDWFGRIVRGEASGPGALAKSEGLDRSYVSRVLCLAFLSPEIVKTILEGQQATELTTKRLMMLALDIPLDWADQGLFLSLRI